MAARERLGPALGVDIHLPAAVGALQALDPLGAAADVVEITRRSLGSARLRRGQAVAQRRQLVGGPLAAGVEGERAAEEVGLGCGVVGDAGAPGQGALVGRVGGEHVVQQAPGGVVVPAAGGADGAVEGRETGHLPPDGPPPVRRVLRRYAARAAAAAAIWACRSSSARSCSIICSYSARSTTPMSPVW